MAEMRDHGEVLRAEVGLVGVRGNAANPHVAVHVVLFDGVEADIDASSSLGHIRLRRKMLSCL